jgi:hypothetical protein
LQYQEYISLALGLLDVLPIGTTTKQKLIIEIIYIIIKNTVHVIGNVIV